MKLYFLKQRIRGGGSRMLRGRNKGQGLQITPCILRRRESELIDEKGVPGYAGPKR